MYYVIEHMYILENFFLIEVWLLYSVELVSGVQQSKANTHTHTHIYLFQILFHYRFLQDGIVPCAIQSVLVVSHPCFVFSFV